MDGGVKETAGTQGWGFMARFEVGLEAKIAISLRLCLETHLKEGNIFWAPQYGKGIIDSSGNSIQQDSKYNHTKHAGKNWELVGVGVGIVAEVVDGTCCPNRNDLNSNNLRIQLTSNFNNTVNLWHMHSNMTYY